MIVNVLEKLHVGSIEVEDHSLISIRISVSVSTSKMQTVNGNRPL